MIKYLKEEMKHLPTMLVISILFFIIGTFATNDSIDAGSVRYADANLEADNVQDAIDETFFHASDYNNADNQVTIVETKVGSDSLTTTNSTITGAINELKTNKADLTGPIFTGSVTVQRSPASYVLFDASGEEIGRVYSYYTSGGNYIVLRVKEKNSNYYTNYFLPGSSATTENVAEAIATTNDVSSSHSYGNEDIDLSAFLNGYGYSSTSIRFVYPVPKSIPSGKTYSISVQTIDNIYKSDGTSISTTGATFSVTRAAGGTEFFVNCNGLSGITVGARYRIRMSGTKKITIS